MNKIFINSKCTIYQNHLSFSASQQQAWLRAAAECNTGKFPFSRNRWCCGDYGQFACQFSLKLSSTEKHSVILLHLYQ